jgi:hypothetical protein
VRNLAELSLGENFLGSEVIHYYFDNIPVSAGANKKRGIRPKGIK